MTAFVANGALVKARSSDARCIDHMPACPWCGDLSSPHARDCETCGKPLRWKELTCSR